MCGNTLRRWFAISLICASSAGCGFVENWVQTNLENLPSNAGIPSTVIEGQVDEFVVSSGMSAQSACNSVQAYLFSLDDNGKKVEPAIASVEVINGLFEFTDLDLALGLTNLGASTPLLLQAYGCNKLYSRIVTSAFEQKLNLASNVVSSLVNSTLATKTVENLKKDAGKTCAILISALEEDTDPAQMITKLNSTLNSTFEKLAGIDADPNVLSQSFPAYLIKAIPDTLSEGQAATFEIVQSHWSSSYASRVEWRDSAGVLSTSAAFVYTPGKNTQTAAKTFTLVLGALQGGTVDSAKPKFQASYNLNIADDFPAIVPPITLSSSPTSRLTKVLLTMNTGTALANCETFSKIAINVNQTTAPTPSAFDTSGLSCSSENSQILTYNLPNSVDGAKALRIWTMDSSGNISASPALINMTLDSNAPVLAFVSPTANTNFLAGTEITGTCEMGLDVIVGGTGASTQQSLSCTAPGVFAAEILFSAGDGPKQIDILQVYADGSNNTVSRQFVYDTTGPAVTIDSPAPNTTAATGVTITGDCENGLEVNITGPGVDSPNVTSCSAGRYSQAILFTAGAGQKTVYIDQTDLAGNITSVTRAFIRSP